MMIIYRIKNNITNQSYIGKTINAFNRRYRSGMWWKYTENNYLKNSANKYGKENFSVEILCKAEDEFTLDWLEQVCVAHFDTIFPKGFNLTAGGEGGSKSEDSRLKMSISGKKKVITEEHKNNVSKGLKEFYKTNPSYPRTPEIIAKQVKTRGYVKPWNLDLIHQAKIGTKQSEETKEKRAATFKLKDIKPGILARENSRKSKIKKVVGTNILTGEEIVYNAMIEAKKDGFTPSCISDCCTGKIKKHKGYTWKYWNEKK